MKLDPERLANSPPNVKDLICSICLHICWNPVCISPCEHIFCHECIKKWLASKRVCPNDMQSFSEIKPPSRLIRNLFDSLKYYCDGCNTALNANQLASHKEQHIECGSKQMETLSHSFNVVYVDLANYVFYVDCDANTPINDEKLGSIIGYVTKTIPEIEPGKNKKERYDNYCKALENKFGRHDPHEKSVELQFWDKDTVVNEIKSLLSQDAGQFNCLIEDVANKSIVDLHTAVDNILHVFYRKNEINFTVSEFVVLKIFQSKENLYYIPCYVTVSMKKIRKRIIFVPWESESNLFIEYSQKKFALSKYDLQNIIKEVKIQADNQE